MASSAGDNDVEKAGLLFGNSWVDGQAPLKQTDTHGGNGTLERNVRAIKGSGGRSDAENIRVILAVGGKHHAHDLSFRRPAFREQRPERAVDEP